MKSSTIIPPQMIQRRWLVVDAEGATLGRLASRVAALLTGKRKSYYVPHQDCGDNVVIINAKAVKVSGKKETEHVYYRHSGYPGALKTETLNQVREKFPARIIERTVRGMMPKTKLGRAMMKKLYVFENEAHPYADKVIKVETLR